MSGIAIGVLLAVGASTAFALVLDREVREGALTFLYAVVTAPFVLTWFGLAGLLRLLPNTVRPRGLRGRRLSVAALQRVANRAAHEGWMISTRRASIIVIRRKAK